jgi:paraquat-inducible protein B
VKREVTLSLIWLVPAVAAVVAGFLVFQNLQRFGPSITIEFESASGLDANQTIIRYRGVRVGSVQSVQLTKDLKRVEVRARLNRFAAALAREGSVFWIVRPEVGAAGVHALETIVSGPYIEAMPGSPAGKAQTRFLGEEEAPVIKQGNGVEFVLYATLVRSLGPNSPVYFRGLQAGKVQYLELSDDSATVKVHVLVKPSFAPLVRASTVWWNAGGIDVNWHLLSGLSMTAENLRAVVTGGVAFATPNEPGEPAPAGMTFALHERPELKWLEWSPRIAITNAAVSSGSQPPLDLENVNQPQKQQ